MVDGNNLPGNVDTLNLHCLNIEYVCNNGELTCVFTKLDGDKASKLNKSRVHHIKLKARSGSMMDGLTTLLGAYLGYQRLN